jgi:hypothetical protein
MQASSEAAGALLGLLGIVLQDLTVLVYVKKRILAPALYLGAL